MFGVNRDNACCRSTVPAGCRLGRRCDPLMKSRRRRARTFVTFCLGAVSKCNGEASVKKNKFFLHAIRMAICSPRWRDRQKLPMRLDTAYARVLEVRFVPA